MIGTGTIVNVLAIVLGSFIGMLLNGGIKQRFQNILTQVLGLATIFIGVSGALKGMFVVGKATIETTGTMVIIISMVIGAFVGEAMKVEDGIERFGEWLKLRFSSGNDSKFVEGFVSATLVTGVGAMAIVGSLNDGLTGDASMLYTKSILDFIVVMIFASTLGKGVIFSAIPIGIFQGFITIFAHFIEPILTKQMIQNISLVGSVLIFGIGINLAFGKKFKVGNMLPALLVAAICSLFKGL
ncbi:membrane protein [Clostridium acetobutylicum]|nr:membrane protein [Clostridium acetobutylicum]